MAGDAKGSALPATSAMADVQGEGARPLRWSL